MKKNLPPISEISLLVLALVVSGGIYLASHLPHHVSLVPTTILVGLAGFGVLINLILLSRIRTFDWAVFTLVAKWTLLAYGLIAGALEYIFIKDGTRGTVLAVMTGALFVFAINLPIHFGFTVARYSDKTA
jgi:uncharacterized membrane protein YoaK (UPF0700 family)